MVSAELFRIVGDTRIERVHIAVQTCTEKANPVPVDTHINSAFWQKAFSVDVDRTINAHRSLFVRRLLVWVGGNTQFYFAR
jgi:hypothetical protein